MEPPAAHGRRPSSPGIAVLLLVFGTIALHFGVLLDPGEDLEGGSTGLYPGTYADAIVPAHLLAFAILTALVTWLSAQGSPPRAPPKRHAGRLRGRFRPKYRTRVKALKACRTPRTDCVAMKRAVNALVLVLGQADGSATP